MQEKAYRCRKIKRPRCLRGYNLRNLPVEYNAVSNFDKQKSV